MDEQGFLQLSELPPVLLAQALEFADLRTLLAFECTSTSAQQLIRDFQLWRELMQSTTYIAQHSTHQHIDGVRWKRFAQLAALPAHGELQLLEDVRDCSSVDNPGERPENTLTRSTCEREVEYISRSVLAQQPIMLLEWSQRIQLKCGCARGAPCYWSTAASWKHTGVDYLEYHLSRECLVSSVRVVPYRVFWYPGSPTYSPLQLSFSFHELIVDGEEEDEDESMEEAEDSARRIIGTLGPAIYESPVYDAIADMKMQELELPRKVFLSRGVLRLNLFNRQQDLGPEMMEWHADNGLPPFYICLSHVGATGRCFDTMGDE